MVARNYLHVVIRLGLGVIVTTLIAVSERMAVAQPKKVTDWKDFPRHLPPDPNTKPLAEGTKWKDEHGDSWTAFKIELPEHAEPFLYVCQQSLEFGKEHEQGVVFGGGQKIIPLPYNCGGKIEIDFFWLGSTKTEGPFVRLLDYWGEYIVDLRNKSTFQIVRTAGRSFIGEVSGRSPRDANFGIEGAGSEIRVYVGKNRAKEITSTFIAGEGKRLGRIRE